MCIPAQGTLRRKMFSFDIDCSRSKNARLQTFSFPVFSRNRRRGLVKDESIMVLFGIDYKSLTMQMTTICYWGCYL